jgi:hypothetical protein
MITCSIMRTLSSRKNPNPLSKYKVIMKIFLVLNLMEMIILKLRSNCFSRIYKTYIYVQGEIYSHMVHKDNHVIKSVTQGKKVMNKVTVHRL